MGDSPTARKKKKREEIKQIRLMSDREYIGPIKTTSVGEKFLEGYGQYTWETPGITYEGPFKNSQIIGYGRCKWKDGRMHEGEFVGGKRHGNGVFISAEGTFRYKGGWNRGMREGNGVMIYEGESWHDIQKRLEAEAAALAPPSEKAKEKAKDKSSDKSSRGDDRSARGGDNNSAADPTTTTAREKKSEILGQDFFSVGFETSRYTAWYSGEWLNGKKHGQGMQQWRPGVYYDGEFNEGMISGFGIMRWSEKNRNEEYKGQWMNNQPHGQGTHTWHSLRNVRAELDRHTSQQCNNVYSGDWDHGLRHGYGTFSYANGARYSGGWCMNRKHDPNGRYTFEDGTTYQGAFHDDKMVNYKMNLKGSNGTVNIGGDDNPIKQCISIEDLRYLDSPSVGGLGGGGIGGSITAGSITSGGSSNQRGIFNMLLRYLSEMKTLYLRYRKILKRETDDPFVLTSLQFWCLARDLLIVSPTSSLARLDRWLFKGRRWHSEISPVDFEVFDRVAQYLNDASPNENNPAGSCLVAPPTTSAAVGTTSDGSGATTSGGSGGPTTSCGSGGPTTSTVGMFGQEYGSYRALGNGLMETHTPTSILLFRHFMEGLVRIAPVRYPQITDGLEVQLERLFKDCIIPSMSKPSVSLSLFEHFHDEDIKYLLEPYESKLLDIFISLNNGDGQFGRGLINGPLHKTVESDPTKSKSAKIVESEEEESKQDNKGDTSSNKQENSSNKQENSSNKQDSSKQDSNKQDTSTAGLVYGRDGTTSVLYNSDGSRLNRILSGNRRSHINARLDITVRFKDVLQMLWDMGMLEPTVTLQKDVTSSVIPPMAEDGALDSVAGQIGNMNRSRGSFMNSDLQRDPNQAPPESTAKWPSGLDTILGGGGEGAPVGFSINAAALLAKKKDMGTASMAGSGVGGASMAGGAVGADGAGGAGGEGGEGTEAVVQEIKIRNQQEDIMDFDWRMKLKTVLEAFLEMSAPKTIYNLQYFVPQHGVPQNGDAIGLMDFLETDLNFSEFTNFLCELSYLGCIGEKGEPLLAIRRPKKIEAFLHYIFLPAFETKYTFQNTKVEDEVEKEEEVEEAEEEEPKKEEEEEKGDDDGDGEDADVDGEEEKAVEEEAPPIVTQILKKKTKPPYSRRIPDNYLASVAAWV